MASENSPKRFDRPSESERPRRRVAVKVAFFLAMAAAAGLMTWVAYQVHCFQRERQARVAIEADSGVAAIVGGPTAEEAPFLSLSELRHARLYVPIVHVTIGRLLKHFTLDRQVWDQLRSFRYLERLDVSGCTCEPSLEADFSGFRHLRSVAIVETDFAARDIRTLARLPELQDAIFKKNQGMDKWLPSIAQLRQLRTLEIRGDASDGAMESLAGLPVLGSLSVESDRLTSKAVPSLAKLKKLKALTLSRTRIDNEGLRQLGAMKGLTQLDLAQSDGISDEGVGFLATLESLESLNLAGTRITSKSVQNLRLINLKYLVLNHTEIDDEGLRRLANIKNLELLGLNKTRIADVGAELRFPNLCYLDLGNTHLTDLGLRHIARSPKLRCLVIAGTRVTDASIETLAGMPSLVEVYAYGTQIDEASPQWSRLMKALESKRANEQAVVLHGYAGSRPQ